MSEGGRPSENHVSSPHIKQGDESNSKEKGGHGRSAKISPRGGLPGEEAPELRIGEYACEGTQKMRLQKKGGR